MNIFLSLLFLLAGAYLLTVLEEWSATGRFRLAKPLKSWLSYLGQESLLPCQVDQTLYEVAPVLLLVATLLAAAVLPVAPGTIMTDLATGALFVNSALAYVMVAALMAGWGSNGVYPMIGGWRFLAQLVAYSMLVVMPITAAAMRAESLFTTQIVSSQENLWNVLAQPLGFGLFGLAAMAVAFLPPFDLPVAPGELAGGFLGEYSGVRYAIFRLARFVLVFTLAQAITVFYLGGWLGPFLPGWAWTFLKTFAIAGLMLVGGRYLPRFKEEFLLEWSWKLGIPLALVNIFWVGVTVLLVK